MLIMAYYSDKNKLSHNAVYDVIAEKSVKCVNFSNHINSPSLAYRYHISFMVFKLFYIVLRNAMS